MLFTAQAMPSRVIKHAQIPTSMFRAHNEELGYANALSLEIDQFDFLAKAIFRLSNRLFRNYPWPQLNWEDEVLLKFLFTRLDAGLRSAFFSIDTPSMHAAHSGLWDLVFGNTAVSIEICELVLAHMHPNQEWMTVARVSDTLHACDVNLVPLVLKALPLGIDGATLMSQFTKIRSFINSTKTRFYNKKICQLFDWAKTKTQCCQKAMTEALWTKMRRNRCRWWPSVMEELAKLEACGLQHNVVKSIKHQIQESWPQQVPTELGADIYAAIFSRVVTIGEQAMISVANFTDCSMTSSSGSGIIAAMNDKTVRNSVDELENFLGGPQPPDDVRAYRKRYNFLHRLVERESSRRPDETSCLAVAGFCFWSVVSADPFSDLLDDTCQRHCWAEHSAMLEVASWATLRLHKDAWADLIGVFVKSGAALCPRFLTTLFWTSSTAVLAVVEALLRIGISLTDIGPDAMVKAVVLRDRDAIDRLKSLGVDINGTISIWDFDDGILSRSIPVAASERAIDSGMKAFLQCQQFLDTIGATRLDTHAYAVIFRNSIHCMISINQVALQDFKTRLKTTQMDQSKGAPFLNLCLTRSSTAAVEVSTLLLDLGVQPDVDSICHAIEAQAPSALIQRLIEAGADVNAYGSEGDLPLVLACERGDLRLANVLIAAGADPHATPAHGGRGTLLVTCGFQSISALEEFEQSALAELLLSLGVEVDGSYWYGRTPLHAAIEASNIELVIVLLDHGAAHSIVNSDEQTPLDVAAEYGRLDAVQLLLNVGATSGIRNKTCFDGAIAAGLRKSNTEVVKLLRRAADTPENEAAQRLWELTQISQS